MIGYRSYRILDLWDEMSRINRVLNRAFGDSREAPFAAPCAFPPMNVYDDGASYVVRAELPGIDGATLSVEATASSLTIKGERRRDEDAAGSVHRRERDFGVFDRSIKLPQPVNPDKVAASYALGVLEVSLPKAEEAKPRKVAIAS